MNNYKIFLEYLTNGLNDSSRIGIIAFGLYTVLSIIFTYPVIFLKDRVPGVGDVFFCLWELWWFKASLLNHVNPYCTSYIFYPTGINLIFADLSPFIGVLAVPLQLLLGLVKAYNILWILSFVLSGYGMFLLVKYLTQSNEAAFISGLIFMFCPYHFAHALGHLSLLNIEWIPFYILYLIKLTREPIITNSLYAALFLLITGMSSMYYLLYLFIFTFVYIVYFSINDRSMVEANFFKKIGVMTASFAIVYSPILYLMIDEFLKTRSKYMYAPGFVEYSADILAFFTPSPLHPFLSGLFSSINSSFTGNPAEYTVFAGYTVLSLSIISILKARSKEVVFWALSALLFFILSLGPILHLHGIFSIHIEDYKMYVLLPYALLMHIPFLSLMRVPSRWDIMLMLSLSVLSGYGCNYIFNSINQGRFHRINKRSAVFIIICSLVLLEYLSVPYFVTSSTRVPAFYELIGKEKQDYALLELGNSGFNSKYMYYQTTHNKKLINGYVARAPGSTFAFMAYTPFISQLMNTIEPTFPVTEDILDQNYTDVGRSVMIYYDIKYIILHKDALTKEQFNRARLILQSSTKENPENYENGTMFVYEAGMGPEKPFMVLDRGWYGLESWNNITTRWISNDAVLYIYSGEDQIANLSLKALSFLSPRTLKVYVAEKPVAKSLVGSAAFAQITIPISIIKGYNAVRFHVSEGCVRPIDIPGLNNPDSRCLSIAMQNITLS